MTTNGAKPTRLQAPRGEAGYVPPAATIVRTPTPSRSDGILTPEEPRRRRRPPASGSSRSPTTTRSRASASSSVRRGGGRPRDLPGIEINTVVADRDHIAEGEVHILDSGSIPTTTPSRAHSRQREARRIRFEKMVAGCATSRCRSRCPRAARTTDEDALGRPRVARALIIKGHAASVEDAFNRHLSRGRPAYVPREGLGPRGRSARSARRAGLPRWRITPRRHRTWTSCAGWSSWG